MTSSSASYRAIFFDAGGTLLKPQPSVGEVYARVAEKYDMSVDHQEVERVFRQKFTQRDHAAASLSHTTPKEEKAWWHSLVLEVFQTVTMVKNFEPFFEELYDLFARGEVWTVYPEVFAMLASLKEKKMILGVVSNWDTRLPQICDQLKLASFFDFIIASVAVGVAKPEAGIFKLALERAGVRKHEALHVGDSIENDYLGAKRAGLDAVLIHREAGEPPQVPFIRSLSELLTWSKRTPAD